MNNLTVRQPCYYRRAKSRNISHSAHPKRLRYLKTEEISQCFIRSKSIWLGLRKFINIVPEPGSDFFAVVLVPKEVFHVTNICLEMRVEFCVSLRSCLIEVYQKLLICSRNLQAKYSHKSKFHLTSVEQ